MVKPAATPLTTNPKQVIATYLLLVVVLSSIFWYILISKPPFAVDTGLIRYSVFLLMWCPAIAAIITRLAFQKNLSGFGFKPGDLRWWLLAIIIPIVVGAVMFGAAWISGVAPFLPGKAAAILSLSVIQAILVGLCLDIISAMGEELGWREWRMNFNNFWGHHRRYVLKKFKKVDRPSLVFPKLGNTAFICVFQNSKCSKMRELSFRGP